MHAQALILINRVQAETGNPDVQRYILHLQVVVEKNAFKTISIKLKYQGKKNVIEGLRRVSKPGLRHYVGATEIPRVRGGLGVAVISTPEGVMTDVQARKKNLGGELLCYIW